MPLPKALQDAINDTPTPDSSENVFDFDSGNPVVKNVDMSDQNIVDTNADNWLENLMTEGDTPTDIVDDFAIPENTDAFAMPNLDDKSQVDELREIIEKLEDKVTSGERSTQEEEALTRARSAMRDRYGEADDDLLENFADLFSTFRSKIGMEFSEELLNAQTASDKRIAQLESKIEAMSTDDKGLPNITQDATPGNYRDLMAEAIPDYQKIVSSQTFKRLLATPVDGDNPEFTFNKKLGKLYGQRKTADIMKFFSSFASKYAGEGSNGAVVDSGSSSPSKGGQGVNSSLSPDRLRSIFKRVMSGELKLSEDEMSKLRTMAAKQAMN